MDQSLSIGEFARLTHLNPSLGEDHEPRYRHLATVATCGRRCFDAAVISRRIDAEVEVITSS